MDYSIDALLRNFEILTLSSLTELLFVKCLIEGVVRCYCRLEHLVIKLAYLIDIFTIILKCLKSTIWGEANGFLGCLLKYVFLFRVRTTFI